MCLPIPRYIKVTTNKTPVLAAGLVVAVALTEVVAAVVMAAVEEDSKY